MEVKKIQKKEVEVITDVICDSCGKSCKSKDRISEFIDYMNLKINWGYGSDHDLETWTAQICENCIKEKLGFIKFKKKNSSFTTSIC